MRVKDHPAVASIPGAGAPPAVSTFAAPARLDFIDSLRCFAALGVLLVHVSQNQAPDPRWQPLCGSGMYGVQLFYLVSAATLFLSHRKRRSEANPLRNYFIRRFFRIAPLFYVAVLAYVIVDGLGPRYWAPAGIHARHVAATVLFSNGWYPTYINSVVPVGWSIAVETNFYVLCPLLFFLIRKASGAVIFLGLALVLALTFNPLAQTFLLGQFPADQRGLVNEFLYFWLPNQLPVFALGIVTYFGFESLFELGPSRRYSILFLAIFLLLAHSILRSNPLFPVAVEYNWGLAFVALTLGLAAYPWSGLVNPVTAFLGRISYGVYLFQFLALYFCKWAAPACFEGPASSARFLCAYLLVAGVTIVFATAAHYLVERPGQSVGKALISRLARKNTQPASAQQ